MAAFFRRRGYKLTRERFTRHRGSTYLAYGTHAVGTAHMALYRDGALYYDPAGRPKHAFKGDPMYLYIPSLVRKPRRIKR